MQTPSNGVVSTSTVHDEPIYTRYYIMVSRSNVCLRLRRQRKYGLILFRLSLDLIFIRSHLIRVATTCPRMIVLPSRAPITITCATSLHWPSPSTPFTPFISPLPLRRGEDKIVSSETGMFPTLQSAFCVGQVCVSFRSSAVIALSDPSISSGHNFPGN